MLFIARRFLIYNNVKELLMGSLIARTTMTLKMLRLTTPQTLLRLWQLFLNVIRDLSSEKAFVIACGCSFILKYNRFRETSLILQIISRQRNKNVLFFIKNSTRCMPLEVLSQVYPHEFQLQEFQYFVVIDFEAACDREKFFTHKRSSSSHQFQRIA